MVSDEHHHSDHQRKLNDGRIGQQRGEDWGKCERDQRREGRNSAKTGHDQPHRSGAQADRPSRGDQYTIGGGDRLAAFEAEPDREGVPEHGAAAVLIAVWLSGHDAVLWAGTGAVLGHAFPVWLGFKGGKAVATSYGVLIAAAWPVGLCAGAVWLALAALGRMSSLAALMSFALAPIVAAVLADATVVKLALVIAVLVFVRHHANIRRLIAGTEPRIGQKA